jgi:hypothetical protein
MPPGLPAKPPAAWLLIHSDTSLLFMSTLRLGRGLRSINLVPHPRLFRLHPPGTGLALRKETGG